jgi:O-antigen ligase
MKVTASSFDFFTSQEFHMTQNIGNIERIIRIVGGLVLIALAATGTVGVWGWLGLVPLATGLTGWCPPYSLLGINTCKNKNT